MKNYILASLAIAAAAAPALSYDFSYVASDAALKAWGTGRAETYAVAIKVPGEIMTGKKVTAIYVPVPEGATLSGCSAFISAELKGSLGKPTVDLSCPFEPAAGMVRVALPQAYSIAGDFYAGYTFKTASKDGMDGTPVVVAASSHDDGLYVTTTRTYKKWTKTELGVASAIKVEIEGEFTADSGSVTDLDDLKVAVGKSDTGSAELANSGTTPITSAHYVYTVGGKSTEGTVQFDPAIPADMLSSGEFTYDVPALDALGTYTGTLAITKINGKDCSATATNSVQVMTVVPRKRVVLEEFTGTWCGYCPRGAVALELLNKKYPDRVVTMAYHDGDIMQTQETLPVPVDGYPAASIDRTVDADPYLGSAGKVLGIYDDIDDRLDEDVAANVSLEASFSEDGSKINAKASVYYFNDYAENPYLLTFTVTDDGLRCPDPSDKKLAGVWMQSNYYTGDSSYGPDMEWWENSPKMVETTYNDVLLATSPYKGIEGSQPASVKAGQTAEGSTSFDCSTFLSLLKNYTTVNLLQNRDKVSVCALLVNKTTGRIENAAKVLVPAPAAVRDLGADSARTATGTELYDLSGRRIQTAPESGIFIEITNYSDGTRRATKRVR